MAMRLLPRHLQQRLEVWLLVRAVTEAAERLKAKDVGLKLDAALDKQFGPVQSEVMQVKLAGWLLDVVDELNSDQT